MAVATLVIIDDDPHAIELVQDALEDQPDLAIKGLTDPAAGVELVLKTQPEIVLLDLVMPQMDGMEALERIAASSPSTDVILLTGNYAPESAVEAIRKGASDYLTKPVSVRDLRERVARLVEEARRRSRLQKLESEYVGANSFQGMVGRSGAIYEVFNRIRRVAPHFRSALVRGSTGTGKELAARALHELSPAAKGPFVVCNCSAVVETLFESELFGYVKGAFTGADQDRAGLFEYADNGTLFLDELGDMPFGMQSKLLRALQNQEIRRVGATVVKKVNVRIVAATNRDLEAMIENSGFRQDLYYRLSMVEVHLPRLAERPEDIPLLTRHFVDLFSKQFNKPIKGLTPRAQAVLVRYGWPGNIRELENVIGNACMMAETEVIDVHDLPEYLFKPSNNLDTDDMLTLAELERRYALRILERMGGNKVKTAEVLGISRATLYRIIEQAEKAAQV